jgi:hypothetical protein
MTDGSQGEVNVRLFIAIETEGRATDGTFKVTTVSGQIRGLFPGWPEPLHDGYCNLADLNLTESEMAGVCLPGWRPTVEPIQPPSLKFAVRYQNDGSVLDGSISSGKALFRIRLHRLRQNLSTADGTWVAVPDDGWGRSAGIVAVLHVETGMDGRQIAIADYLHTDYANWGLEFIVVGQSDRRSIFLIAGHGKGSRFHGELSADNKTLVGRSSGGQFLPNTLTRVAEAGRPNPK